MKVAVLSMFLMVLMVGTPAAAYDLRPGSYEGGAVTGLQPGLKQLGFESLYLLNVDTSEGDTRFRLSFIGGATFDYFLKKNFSLGVNLSFLAKRSATPVEAATDIGGLLTVGVAYSASLGGGMFIRPSIALGGFVAQRTTRLADIDAASVGTVYGGTVKLGVEFVFYASRGLKVHAGPVALLNLGAHAPDTGGSTFILGLDSGFNIGISKAF